MRFLVKWRIRCSSGRNLRDVIDIIDELQFQNTGDELDQLSALYEDRLKLMGGGA